MFKTVFKIKRNKISLGLSPAVFSGAALNDGQWHSVDFTARRGRLTISVDKGEGGIAHAAPSFPITTESQLFFGGKSEFRLLGFYKLKNFEIP